MFSVFNFLEYLIDKMITLRPGWIDKRETILKEVIGKHKPFCSFGSDPVWKLVLCGVKGNFVAMKKLPMQTD